MPLEIRELIIKVAVNENNESAKTDPGLLELKMIEMKNKVMKECLGEINKMIVQKSKER